MSHQAIFQQESRKSLVCSIFSIAGYVDFCRVWAHGSKPFSAGVQATGSRLQTTSLQDAIPQFSTQMCVMEIAPGSNFLSTMNGVSSM